MAPYSNSEIALANYVCSIFEEYYIEGHACGELMVFFLRRIRNGDHTIKAIEEAIDDIGWTPYVKPECPQIDP